MRLEVAGFLRLARPANIITAHADILAGWAAAPAATPAAIPFLLLATTGLYGGGVVFNDVFDSHLDATERPERPIPTGAVSVIAAAIFGAALLGGAVFLAWWWSPLSGIVAAATAVAALVIRPLRQASLDAGAGKHGTVPRSEPYPGRHRGRA